MQVEENNNSSESNTAVDRFIYTNWKVDKFKDLYKLLTGKNMNQVLSNFMQSYVHIMENFETYKNGIGYEDLSFKYYFDNMIKFYGNNVDFMDRVNPAFSKLFVTQNGEVNLQVLKSAIQVDSEYFHFLGNCERHNVPLLSAGFKTFVGYLTSRFISYYHSDAPVYIKLDDAVAAWNKLITECHRNVKCSFNFDYGWSSVDEWLSLIDNGKKQIIVSYGTISPQVFLVDFLNEVLSQKPYARNENAVNLLKSAASNYPNMIDKVEAASMFMRSVSATSTFKEIQDNYRKTFQVKK